MADSRSLFPRVAALFVEAEGPYGNLPGVEVWDEERDARLYDGPHPVVAHPPCKRWSILGLCRGYYDGLDGGCFEAALHAVRTYGGVLEHPAHTLAWKRFGLPRPPGAGWATSLGDDGWACEVDQHWYGHPARKPTWLYAVNCSLYDFAWGLSPLGVRNLANYSGGGDRSTSRERTPVVFRDLLLAMARSVPVPRSAVAV